MNKNEALDILRDLHEKSLLSVRTALGVFFPEFKESEGEKIRKFRIKMARNGHGGNKEWWDKCVDWLENDAFIEKACDAYCKVCKMPNCRRNECKFISEFINYMKGE